MSRRVLLTAGACAAAGLLLVLLRWEEPGATAFCCALTVAALALGAAVDRRPVTGPGTRLSWAGAVLLLAAGTAWAALRTGAPGTGAPLLLAGATVAAGALAVRARHSAPVAGGRAGALAVAVAVLATAALGAAAVPVLDRVAVTTRVAPGEPAGPTAVPEPLAVRWRWDAGASVRDVRAAGPGLVVLRDDEVVGLDGPTGTPRWSHRRAGAPVVQIDVSPDRSAVVVTSEVEPLRGGRNLLLTVLDATTGERRWAEVVAAPPLVVDDHVVVVAESAARAPARVGARALRSGERTWWRDAGPRCRFLDGRASAIVLLEECPGPVGGPRSTLSLRAFEPARGGELWASTPTPGGGGRTLGAETSVDGRLALALDGSVLDAARGTVVLPAQPGSSVRAGAGALLRVHDGGGVVEVIDDGGVRPMPSCPPDAGPYALATVPSGVAVLCRDGTGAVEVRTGSGAPPLPVGSPEVPQQDGVSARTDAPWLVAAPGVVAVSDSGAGGTGGAVVGLG